MRSITVYGARDDAQAALARLAAQADAVRAVPPRVSRWAICSIDGWRLRTAGRP